MAKGYPMFKDEIGKRYGKLIVISQASMNPKKSKRARWLCRCDCGREKIIIGSSLRTGHSKSCGFCNPIFYKPFNDSSVFNSLFSVYRSQARKRGYSWNLTKEDVRRITSQDCFYCGSSPSQVFKIQEHDTTYIYNGIDRVDNRIGYVLENCVPCCKTCNIAKRDLGYEEFKNHIKNIFNNWAYK